MPTNDSEASPSATYQRIIDAARMVADQANQSIGRTCLYGRSPDECPACQEARRIIRAERQGAMCCTHDSMTCPAAPNSPCFCDCHRARDRLLRERASRPLWNEEGLIP